MKPFKIAAAQVASMRGDLGRNIQTHLAAIRVAAAQGVSVLVFPELSLTGYEPDLAATHALTASDARLDSLADSARLHRMQIVVGAPLSVGDSKPALGAILFQPDGSRRIYAKMHLGGSEPNYFVPGNEPLMFESAEERVGLSICADSSAPSHPQTYATQGATIYAAGVFLNAEWYATDAPRLASYAPAHRVLVVMANHAASVGTYVSVGRSAIWAPEGARLAQVEDDADALVIASRSRDGWQAEVACLGLRLRQDRETR
jgi:predicted amidohydrolase